MLSFEEALPQATIKHLFQRRRRQRHNHGNPRKLSLRLVRRHEHLSQTQSPGQ